MSTMHIDMQYFSQCHTSKFLHTGVNLRQMMKQEQTLKIKYISLFKLLADSESLSALWEPLNF